MEILAEYTAPITAAIVFALVQVTKGIIPEQGRRYIPIACAVIGLVFAMWGAGWSIAPDVILTGLASGLAATGLHQAGTQLSDKDTMDVHEE
jgi:hypothetical protein